MSHYVLICPQRKYVQSKRFFYGSIDISDVYQSQRWIELSNRKTIEHSIDFLIISAERARLLYVSRCDVTWRGVKLLYRKQ